MNLWHAVILGIVEGITEFLPISSTGHLILTSQLLGLPQTNFLKSFEISIQLGAIFSVILHYWKSLLIDLNILKKVIIAFIPTGILGLFLYKFIKQFLFNSNTIIIAALIFGGVILIVFEIFYREKEDAVSQVSEISYLQAFLIGIAQSLSMIPGVSRAAATMMGGLLIGLKRTTIVEFSFLLAVPTMLSATGLDIIKNLDEFKGAQFHFLTLGFITSFLVALISIKFLLSFIKKHTFITFGIYRILIGLLFWWMIQS